MKGILQYGLAASAFAVVMAFGAPALADPTPAPPPPAPASSSQLVVQYSVYNAASGSDNEAAIEQNAFQFAIGNIGANVASGTANQQANALYIDNGSSNFELAGATVQVSGANYDCCGYSDEQSAVIQDNAFGNVSGNVGVNVAAGNMNEQSNTAVILNKDQLAAANTAAVQYSVSNCFDSSFNEGEIEDQAFENAMGNIGVNVAAGDGNQQSNQLIINNNNGATP